MSLTPDGARYLAMRHERVARPFHLRWLIPAICGTDRLRWEIVTRGAVLSLAPLAWWYTGSPWMAACALLPGVWFNWSHPVLVDAPGMALALLAACLWPVCWPAALVVAVLAGCVRETAPVWSAVYAWHPALLVGLVPVAVRWLMKAGGDPCGYDQQLAHPWRASRVAHRGRWLDPFLMVTPWGPLVLGLAAPTPQLGAAIGVGYAQTLIATDTVRLYQWAWPVLALAAVTVAPTWAPLIALGVAFNPWKGDGL